MGIFDFLTKESKGKNPVYVEDNKLVIPRELLDKLIAGINEDTKRKVIRIKTEEKDNIGLTDSKFGGYPYWEDGGVGAFFISEENLKNLDFDKAFYNWDCC